MTITFPETVSFGTSTSAYQIETACEHDWCDVLSRDGHLFSRTTEHEKRYAEDVAIITSLAPNYRMSLMWSRLQRTPGAAFEPVARQEYHDLLQSLTAKGTRIMMVLHHFANPNWFAAMGGWEKAANIPLWIDYARKVVDEYGAYVSSWNTFNEPNLYTSMGWIAGEFPPFKKNMLMAKKVIGHLAQAHDVLYDYIKEKYPNSMVGISHNCTLFAAHNALGAIPARIADWCYMEYTASRFTKTDFFGMSYYARIAYDPLPITYLLRPGRVKALGMAHDDMWEYYPEGLKACMMRYWKQYKKPIIITENGICTNDDTKRIQAIGDYSRQVYEAIQEGVDVQGYYHWSAWDNFEWSLGPTFRFGLYHCDYNTLQRTPKPSAEVYARLAYTRQIEVEP